MQVVACIKQVPDTTQVQIDPKTNTLIRDGIPIITNPYDTHALEESLCLRDRFGLRSVALSMGPPNAETTLRKACALGVDEAILLSDRCFGGADTLATSRVLAAAIARLSEQEEVGLVICGKQTIDGDTAQVGPGIASRLGFSQLTLVDRIEHFDPVGRTIRVRRKLEGRHEIVEAPLPAVLTVVRELNRPRYPSVPMRLGAQGAEIQVWNNQLLQLDEQTIGLKGSPTWVSRIFSPERDKGEILGDGVNDLLPLRRAQLGIAMESGSAATRGAAALVLLGDAFGVLPRAVVEGQRIIAAMQATLVLLLSRTFYVLLIVAAAAMAGLPFPLTPRQNSILAFATVGIPLTVADVDRTAGTISLVIQAIGASTHELTSLAIGDAISAVGARSRDVIAVLPDVADLAQRAGKRAVEQKGRKAIEQFLQKKGLGGILGGPSKGAAAPSTKGGAPAPMPKASPSPNPLEKLRKLF